jgi:dethiobiotin synthetase
MADVAKALGLPVILVCGIRLGCLNHSLLTFAAIESTGCQCAGWIANLLSVADSVSQQNIDYLINSLPPPYLGTMPYFDNNPLMAQKAHLNIDLSL